jgi:hypothetical protein
MSVEVSWAPGEGDVEVDEFVVLRDGLAVGTVAGAETTFLDEDVNLVPGTEYEYQVVAMSGTIESEPSGAVDVRTLAPSPTGLEADPSTPSAVAFHWSRPPDSPLPDAYVVVRDGVELSPVSGLDDFYVEDGLKPATSLDFQVVAVWGDNSSDPSETLTVSTLKWAAPLQGTWPLDVKVTKSPGGSLEKGDSWSDTWTFTPKCSGSNCNIKVSGAISPPGYTARSFTATLTRSGSVYEGSTKAQITTCGSVAGVGGTKVQNTLTLRLTREKTAASGLWSAWSGTLVTSSPRIVASSTYYCPAQSTTFSLTSAG